MGTHGRRAAYCNNGNGQHNYSNDIMGAMASQTISLATVYSTVNSGEDQRNQQRPTSVAFVRGIHLWPVNSPQKWPVTQEMFPFDDFIMCNVIRFQSNSIIANLVITGQLSGTSQTKTGPVGRLNIKISLYQHNVNHCAALGCWYCISIMLFHLSTTEGYKLKTSRAPFTNID